MAVNHFESPIVRGIVFLLGTALFSLAGSVLAQGGQDQLPPHVIDVSPFPGEEVMTDQAITVTFDQPMDPVSVEVAWQMEPAVPGR
jgi:hypothetical protein